MKRYMHTSKKLLSFLLTFIIIFPMFSGFIEVHAAPAVFNITYEITALDGAEQDSGSTVVAGSRLVIEGMGFDTPMVLAGANGTVRLNIRSVAEDKLIIDSDTELGKIVGIENKIKIFNKNGDVELTPVGGVIFNLQSTPSIESVSKDKAYVGDSLDIKGKVFDKLSPTTDTLFVAGTPYILGKDPATSPEALIKDDSRIEISKLKSPNETGLKHVKIVRDFGLSGTISRQIVSELRNSIMVVNQLKGITFDRIDPNSGPVGKPNLINIYVSSGGAELTGNMRVFVQKIDALNNLKEVEGTNLGTITSGGSNIGLKVKLPETWMDTGIVDIVITTPDRGSELALKNVFTYLNVGNFLSINVPNGIIPNFKKETEQKNSTIYGRNIGFFSASSYDKVLDAVYQEVIGYQKYGDFPELSDASSYKVKYTAVYDKDGDGKDAGDPAVTVIREIWVLIGGEARIQENPTNKFSLSSDIIVVKPGDPTLSPKEPTKVDVRIKTTTTIFEEVDADTMTEYYSRSEEAALIGGYTYYPDVTTPFFLKEDITPSYGPNDQEIYMTIKGRDFEVKEDGTEPRVTIGERIISEDSATAAQEIMVFDNNNKIVDGKIIKSGTKLKFKLPPGTDGAAGGVNVTVTNPSEGQYTVDNGFEFRNPDRQAEKMPKITEVKENFADIRGGVVSGETVRITGENFDTSADENPRVYVTIDGEKATVLGKVSSDGKALIIIPPPGTLPGATKLQLINEDGSMASISFDYKLITSNPKITSIVPLKGGSGTKLIIKGEDFVFPDTSVEYNDPKRKGSVVILGGMELNAYKYTSLGQITDNGTNSIYYDGLYDPDNDPDTVNSYALNGHMVEVQDLTTIYVDIPDRFYSYAGMASPDPYMKWTDIPLGSLKVEVLNPDGAKSKEDVKFNFMKPSTDPRIARIIPNSGSVDGGTVVTIYGNDFKQDKLEVYFGSEKSKQVEYVNSTMLRALVPEYPYSLPEGTDELLVPVMVVNYDGGSDSYYDKANMRGFLYRVPGSHPVITSITPNTGSAAGNDKVVIRGLDFRRSPVQVLGQLLVGLPSVYFNGQRAQVEWPAGNTSTISESLTVITPPSLVSGPVDVIVVNYDSGTSAPAKFNYTKSTPSITSVMPSSISSLGNVNVEINGSGFRVGGTEYLFSDYIDMDPTDDEKVNRHIDNSSYAADAIDTIVTFGDETTGDKKTIDTVIGPTYAVIGDLRFDCTVFTTVREMVQVKISLASDDTHTAIKRYYADTSVPEGKSLDSEAQADIVVGSSHMFIINHKMDLGSTVSYDEGILVETTPSSVTITRRIAPYAKIQDEGSQIEVKSPPINKLGVRDLSVINDDKGTATHQITILNPDSSPRITSIDPKNRARNISDKQIVEYNPNEESKYSELFTFVPLDGGAFLTISGSDFRRNVKAYLNDVPLEIVSKSINDDQLIVKVPRGTDADVGKDYRIVVVNEDGGTYDSTMLTKPHYIRYQSPESDPVISTIIPNKSSSRGTSNSIQIFGKNFRLGVKVLINGAECVTTRDAAKPYELINAIIPPGLEPGSKTVQVLNTDFGFAEVKNGLTIISSPEITRILDNTGKELNPLVLSVEGGEKIKIEGIHFFAGAKVVFGAVLKAKSELAQGENGTECLSINNIEMVVIGGTTVNAELQADGSIICTTPVLSMGETSMLILNSDGGVSNVISGSYEKPMPDAPTSIALEAVDGDTMKLEWNKVENIAYYEIFISTSTDGKKTYSDYQYLGSIIPTEISATKLRYFIDGLTPSTWYSVKLKAVNLFGASKLSPSTSYKQTLEYVKVTYYEADGGTVEGIRQSDTYIVNGSSVVYYIGEKALKDSKSMTINFEQPAYLTTSSRTVNAGLRLIMKYPENDVKVNDRDVELALKLRNMYIDEAKAVKLQDEGDSAVSLSLNKSLGARGDEVRLKLQRGYRIIVNPFSIDLALQVRNDKTRIKSFNGDVSMVLKYAESKKALYPGGIFIAYYDSTTKRVEIVSTQDITGKAQSRISKAGEYVLVGKLIK